MCSFSGSLEVNCRCCRMNGARYLFLFLLAREDFYVFLSDYASIYVESLSHRSIRMVSRTISGIGVRRLVRYICSQMISPVARTRHACSKYVIIPLLKTSCDLREI